MDSLLLALAYVSRHHLKPKSADSLASGLPVDGQQWTPELFIRAAQRAGFNAAVAETLLREISPLTLPVTLILSHGEAVVLHAIEGEDCSIVFPQDGDDRQSISLNDLQRRYSGTCLYCIPNVDPEPNSKRHHWFWDTIGLSKGIYTQVLVASLLINIFALVTPLFIMNVYDRVVPNYAIETLWVLASGVLIIFIFDLAMKMLRAYFIDIAGKRADILLSANTFSRTMGIQLAARPKQIGSFANNLQEFDSFREFFTSTTLVTLIDLPFVILFLVIIYGIGGPLALVPLITIPLIIGFGLIVQKPLQRLIEDTFSESAAKHALLIEALSALDTIKSQRAEGQVQTRWEGLTGRLAKLSLRSRLLTSAAINFTQVIQQVSTICVVILGVYLIMDGNLSVGALIACTILTGRCLAPMGQIAGILTRYHHSVAAFRSIDSMMKLPVERPDNRNFLHRDTLNGSIEFRNVSFSYPDQKVPALRSVSFTIRPGERVGIVGKMGSGKTTIQKLCMGFHYPSDGTILLSATDINQLDPQDIRRNALYASQDVQLFSGSIRDNITLGAPLANDEQIRRAAEVSGLLEFLQQHPQGFDMQVGERGSALSGGQRQAVALARAMINDAPLLLLDEPTSGMDSTAEQNFKRHLTQYSNNKTLVLVTHKANMLDLVDRLILINDGKIVSDGPRMEVLAALAKGNTNG